ncbi:endopeptidase La [bacterium]|nr:endopeptidase La [bacterium]
MAKRSRTKTLQLPTVPLRNLVVFPDMVFPILVGRPTSISALEESMMNDKKVFLVAQRYPDDDIASTKKLFRIGTLANLLQIMRLPKGGIKVLVEGVSRAKVQKYIRTNDHIEAKIEMLDREVTSASPLIEALRRKVTNLFEKYAKLNGNIPNEVTSSILNIDNSSKFADLLSAHIDIRATEQQKLLECVDLNDQFMVLVEILTKEIEILKIEQRLEGEVKAKITDGQRKMYLQQQMKAIQEELGAETYESEEFRELLDQIENKCFPKEVEKVALKEFNRLTKMHPVSAEATVVRNYLDWLLELPWVDKTRDNLDIKEARKILDEDHYGLDKVKKRIIEYLSVMRISGGIKGQILCFVGPPGVGKTSLGRSIARSLERKFVRTSLGGVKDEAQIRGHRRTYIGALPGKIVQSLRKAGSINPVFLLDEVDKMGQDVRGDPASALLEVLDPEQNFCFQDHYLEVDYDLSKILFITTANTLPGIPPALQDRMEILRLPGYLDNEKLEIAKGFLIPKGLKAHGLQDLKITFSDNAILCIINNYTLEAGVRELERKIHNIFRVIATQLVEKDLTPKTHKPVFVSKQNLNKYLGPPDFIKSKLPDKLLPGEAIGLAWTAAGGDILIIETALMDAPHKLSLTGTLGDVMKESAKAALSYVRSRADALGIDPALFRRREIHVHIPEGGIPKDGPSAGITIALSMITAFTGKSLNTDIAFTGELTLNGRILPIGGLPEKLLAAKRNKVKKVIIPERNKERLNKVPADLKKNLELLMFDNMDDVLKYLKFTK